ncbi:Uma2 family endonuclease [Roseomonas sp. AR75]|uniref:Uma2 family endonuclease n=1 Tax=Roseomonas sp. AR75 TaxID=2562311 RepID=UPI0010C0FD17|nr:Uma2 family endonuclease [Roseomonas sp. AR75]
MCEKVEPPAGAMTVEQFYVWADQQPRGRYELNRSEIVALVPEAIGHARAEAAAALALRTAIQAAGLRCEAFLAGVGIRVGEDTLYIPDATVNCGPAVGNDARALPAPVIVVEVTSPSTARVDTTDKLEDYFRLPSLHHYLQIDLHRRALFHHRRQEGGGILSTLLRGGALALDPPCITIMVEDLFGIA